MSVLVVSLAFSVLFVVRISVMCRGECVLTGALSSAAWRTITTSGYQNYGQKGRR